MFKNRLTKLLACVLVAATASGCAVFDTVKEKRKIDYQTSRRLPPLEIPPDLTNLPAGKDSPIPGARSTATYSEFISDKKNTPAQAAAVIPDAASDMRLEREGRNRWLVVKAEPDTLWPKVRQFVQSNGLLISRENAQTGVIETDWAENRAKVGTAVQLVLAKWMAALYSTGTRDRFRIRLERGKEPGTTEIYLSHQGMEEVVASGSGSDHISTMWQGRPSDPELETEMLRLLMAHLGAKDPDV
ncbi:MAG: outer membrane protein assembly factor BamC, partial [Burkholderiales bacterium]|nr:outer membrane protein assembly factor BamC [Burkholderiales bacterium]